MEANSVSVELRPGWPMHVGVVTDACGGIVWKAPVARVNPHAALADAEEYLAGAPVTTNDTHAIDQQLDELDALIRANRARVAQSMAAEECNCSRCRSGREFIRQQLAS